MFLFLALLYFLTFVLGGLIRKIKIPWIFASLFLGFFASIYNPFVSVTSSPTFSQFANIGMYLLLFIVGFQLDLEKMKKTSGFIFRATFFIIFFEAVFGILLIHYLFEVDWLISFVVALSFATVGEAVLVPILDEFKMINTKLGQSILGIGILDDLIEVFTLIIVIIMISSGTGGGFDTGLSILSLSTVIILTYLLFKFKGASHFLKDINEELLFLISLFIFFLFIGLGSLGSAEPIGALLAGIGVKLHTPDSVVRELESRLKALTYGMFAPIFFFWVGSSINFDYIVSYPLFVLSIVLVSNGSKMLGSIIMGRKELGMKKSIVMGIGLSIRFSTSIVIIKILYDNNIVGIDLYSAIIASTMAFKLIVPLLFARLLLKWNVETD